MVLSNAERQKRFQQRLRAKAAAGVTPEMIIKATRLMYEFVCEQNQESPDWDQFLTSARKKGSTDRWREMVPNDTREDYREFEDDAPLMCAVSAVAAPILNPPKA